MRTAQQRNGLRKGLSIFLTLYNRANDLPKSIILLRALRYQGNNPNNFKTMTQQEKNRTIEIIEFYGAMLGNNSDECNHLIKEVRQFKVQAPKIIGYEYFCEQHGDKVWSDVMQYSERLGIPFDLLANNSRNGKLTIARNVIWYVIIKELGGSDHINNLLGGLFNRNRTTIRASYGKTKDSVEIGDKTLLGMIETMTRW